MPKPTLIQTLLGRPSQTYSFPPEKQYYSAKENLARAAAVGDNSSAVVIEAAPHHESNGDIPLPSSCSTKEDSVSDDSDDDVFHTPFSSPPTSAYIDMPLSIFAHDPSPPRSSSASSSASSSSSHSASCSTSPTSDELHAALTALSKRTSTPTRLGRVSPASKSYYTDEDWAKEVRWLSQPSSPATRRRASQNMAQSASTPNITNQPKPRPRPRTVIGRPNTNHRMTALLEEDEDTTDDLRASPPPRSSSAPLIHSNHIMSSSHDIRPASQVSHARTTVSLTSRTVDLPQNPTAVAPPAAPGYTALTLPRATYRPQNPWRTLASGHIDLPRDGRAQHSMVSIEVVRGAATASFLRAGLRRRNSSPRQPKKHDLVGALALTSHRPPPSFVPNSHVLVQVHAVGLEGLDRQIVSDRLGSGATGFVPARGIYGRVIECGLEVSSDTLRKGEWVIGLLDAKKCGALSEFVLLNRHHLHRAPQSSDPISTIIDPQSVEAPSFSLESLALLPLIGVPAYRAIQSYAATKSSLPSSSGTALVLRGQDGAGGFATLMLRAIGVNVIVQVEPSIVGLDPSVTATSGPFMLFSPSDDKALGINIPRRLQEVCARLRAWGVEGICIGAPQDVLHSLDVDVDFVLDTVGGREIWHAAHTLLARGTPSRGPAQFTTIVGDAGSGKAVPTAQDHWRAGVRSLRRAMTISRGRASFVARQSPQNSSPSSSLLGGTHTPSARTVGYAWVSCTADVDFEGGDVRDALGALLAMPALQHPPPDALMGLGGEYGAGRVLPFERAPEAFGGAMLEGGGTAVIHIVL